MSEKKGFFHGIIQVVKYTIVAVIFWFVIGAGWNGVYDWYYREVQKEVPDNDKGESFGNKVFVYWLLSFVVESIIFSETKSTILFNIIFVLNVIFFVITFIGLNYFFKKSI